jgi:hypothetical protein
MFNAIKPLVDSGIINEDTRTAIQEAWDVQLSEAKEAVRSELREEFARRYEHDKSVMVEALDKLVTESLQVEIAEFSEEKQALAADRAMFKQQMRESTAKFVKFMSNALAEEIKELRADRKVQNESVTKLAQFVSESLKTEISEFAQDKKAVVETKVRLIAGAKTKLAEMQKAFISRSAKLVQEAVANNLESELTQLREDIQVARENMFGRRLFEAFASEFSVTHLSENKEIAKLQSLVKAKNRQIEESKQVTTKAIKLAESKDREIKVLNESVKRKQVLAELLGPLNKEKATVMGDLLESVGTDKLRTAYDKYLPAVLNSAKTVQAPKGSRVLSESRVEMTGDKTAKVQTTQDSDNVVEIRRLAGLTK